MSETQLGKILYYQHFDDLSTGKPLTDVDAFGACRNGTIVDDQDYHGSGKAIRTGIQAGKEGWAEWGWTYDGVLKDIRLTAGDTLWWRTAMKFPEDFDFSTDHGSLKTFRVGRVRKADSKNRGCVDVQIRSGDLDWRSIVEFTTDGWTTHRGGRVIPGTWQMFEVMVHLHPTVGIIRIWRDGVLFGEIKDIETMDTSSVVDRVLMHTYWNGHAPKTQIHWQDEVAFAVNKQGGRQDGPYLGRDSHGNPRIGTVTASGGVVDPPDPGPDPEPPEPPEPIEGGITLTHDKTMVHVGDNEVIVTSDKKVNVL